MKLIASAAIAATLVLGACGSAAPAAPAKTVTVSATVTAPTGPTAAVEVPCLDQPEYTLAVRAENAAAAASFQAYSFAEQIRALRGKAAANRAIAAAVENYPRVDELLRRGADAIRLAIYHAYQGDAESFSNDVAISNRIDEQVNVLTASLPDC